MTDALDSILANPSLLAEIRREPFHYVPFMTGYEENAQFVAICGRDVTYEFFYCSTTAFLTMPVRQCPECLVLVETSAGLIALAACFGWANLTSGGPQ